jgi:hypothetical protein
MLLHDASLSLVVLISLAVWLPVRSFSGHVLPHPQLPVDSAQARNEVMKKPQVENDCLILQNLPDEHGETQEKRFLRRKQYAPLVSPLTAPA